MSEKVEREMPMGAAAARRRPRRYRLPVIMITASVIVGFATASLAAGRSRVTETAKAACSRNHQTINVLDPPYSATGNGHTNDRAAIQAALDHAGKRCGGTVLLRARHTFLSGGLRVPSRTTLDIEGTLLQSTDPADYATPIVRGYGNNTVGNMGGLYNPPLILAAHVPDVAVVGHGLIQMRWHDNSSSDVNGSSSIFLIPVAFFDVAHYTIRDLHERGAGGPNILLVDKTSRGLIKHLDFMSDLAQFTADGQAGDSDGLTS